MNFKGILFFIFILIPALALAQENMSPDPLDRLMVKRVLTCEDIFVNCSELIPKYFHHQKSDSVELLLDYWERKCGLSEPVYRFKILYAMKQNRFSESMIDDDIWQYLLHYRQHVANKENSDNIRLRLFRILFNIYNYDDLVSDSFDGLTLRLAKENQLRLKPGSTQYLLSLYYANEFDQMIYELQKDERYNQTKIKYLYAELIEKTLKETEGRMAIFTGIWLPRGNNKLLGNHPEVGFLIGGKKRKVLYDLSFLFRFLASKESYQIYYQGKVKNTRHYLGGYLGIDVGYEIWRNWHHEIDLLSGLGWDGFDAVPSTTNKNEDGLTISSFNFNLGLGYRFYPEAYGIKYVGIQTKMNFISYKNKNGTDLSGNAMTIRFEFGFSGNKRKFDLLRQLHYDF